VSVLQAASLQLLNHSSTINFINCALPINYLKEVANRQLEKQHSSHVCSYEVIYKSWHRP
jgi:hypothetical protein